MTHKRNCSVTIMEDVYYFQGMCEVEHFIRRFKFFTPAPKLQDLWHEKTNLAAGKVQFLLSSHAPHLMGVWCHSLERLCERGG